MDLANIQKAYARWAPHYDVSFGIISDNGRSYAVSQMNQRTGTLLEVGVGTGLALPLYAPHLQVSGIDVSQDMLDRAGERAKKENLNNIRELRVMDACKMEYADNTFDTVTAMYIMSVVPDPISVMKEMERVVKPGGEVWIVNHFAKEQGIMAKIERVFAPVCRFIGWHSDFFASEIMGESNLELIEQKNMKPFGLFQVLRFRKNA